MKECKPAISLTTNALRIYLSDLETGDPTAYPPNLLAGLQQSGGHLLLLQIFDYSLGLFDREPESMNAIKYEICSIPDVFSNVRIDTPDFFLLPILRERKSKSFIHCLPAVASNGAANKPEKCYEVSNRTHFTHRFRSATRAERRWSCGCGRFIEDGRLLALRCSAWLGGFSSLLGSRSTLADELRIRCRNFRSLNQTVECVTQTSNSDVGKP